MQRWLPATRAFPEEGSHGPGAVGQERLLNSGPTYAQLLKYFGASHNYGFTYAPETLDDSIGAAYDPKLIRADSLAHDIQTIFEEAGHGALRPTTEMKMDSERFVELLT